MRYRITDKFYLVAVAIVFTVFSGNLLAGECKKSLRQKLIEHFPMTKKVVKLAPKWEIFSVGNGLDYPIFIGFSGIFSRFENFGITIGNKAILGPHPARIEELELFAEGNFEILSLLSLIPRAPLNPGNQWSGPIELDGSYIFKYKGNFGSYPKINASSELATESHYRAIIDLGKTFKGESFLFEALDKSGQLINYSFHPATEKAAVPERVMISSFLLLFKELINKKEQENVETIKFTHFHPDLKGGDQSNFSRKDISVAHTFKAITELLNINVNLQAQILYSKNSEGFVKYFIIEKEKSWLKGDFSISKLAFPAGEAKTVEVLMEKLDELD